MITTWWNGPVGPQRPWRTDVTNATRSFFGYKEGEQAGGGGSKEGVIGGLAKPNASPGAVRGSNASDFISKQEGFRTDAYWDKTGWAVGNGSRTKLDGTPVKEGDKVTKEQATTMLNNYVDTVRSKLEKSVPTWNELNMNQQDALISFGYNVGPDFYGKKDFETITKALSTVDTLKTVPDALKLYKKSGGKVLNGLINRRKAEIDLWNSVVR
jgi:lysozyme